MCWGNKYHVTASGWFKHSKLIAASKRNLCAIRLWFNQLYSGQLSQWQWLSNNHFIPCVFLFFSHNAFEQCIMTLGIIKKETEESKGWRRSSFILGFFQESTIPMTGLKTYFQQWYVIQAVTWAIWVDLKVLLSTIKSFLFKDQSCLNFLAKSLFIRSPARRFLLFLWSYLLWQYAK